MRRALSVLVVLVALAMSAPPAVATAGDDPPPARWRAPGRPQADAVADLEDRFIVTRPTVGATWVVDIGAGTAGERLTARTLQGIVNRTSARLYLREPADAGAQRWLDTYQAEGLVTVAGTTDIDGALDLFASEVSGYVLADESEPWTIAAAATIASARGAIVATPPQVAGLEGRGIGLLEDLRGRWSDAATAYEETLDAHRASLAHPSVAVLRAGDSGFDFAIQQGMAVVFTRPNDPSWPRVRTIIESVPDGHAVFGYLSDTGEEEAVAVGTLAAADLFLVPTDTTRNLSYHLAVGGDRPRVQAPSPDVSSVAECTTDTVNVVVGVSDGDNLNVPLNHFSSPQNWGAPQRGTFPLGWSIGPSLAVLAPAAWDAYAREATPRDELVAMIGYGYAAPALLPDPTAFYRDSFALMDDLGTDTFWSLGGGLEAPTASGWTALDDGAGTGPPHGVLVGYGNGTGRGTAFWSPAGRPAFTSGAAYSQTPGELAAQVQALLDADPGERPLVAFLSATNWSNPVDALVDALAPFEAAGVRFLTPAEATACMPPPPVVEPPVAGPGECLPDEPLSPSGLALVSDAIAGEIRTTPTAVSLPIVVTAPTTAAHGDRIRYDADITVDLEALSGDVLTGRVRPLVAASFGDELARTAWVRMDFDDLVVGVEVDGPVDPRGVPSVEARGPGPDPGASAAWVGDRVEVRVPSAVADTRAPGEPIELHLTWETVADGAGTTVVRAGAPSFVLDLEVGVTLGTTPLGGGVGAAWRCVADGADLAATTIAGAPPSSTTTATTTAAPPTTARSSGTAAATDATTREQSSAPAAPGAPLATAVPRLTG